MLCGPLPLPLDMTDHVLHKLDPPLSEPCALEVKEVFARLCRSVESTLCFACEIIKMEDDWCRAA